MRVLLFAEGSRSVGAGHQVRSAALASAIERHGGQAVLAARDLPGSHHAWAWHGLSQSLLPPAMDARAAVETAVERAAPDVVVVDHYELDAEALAALGTRARVALVDDVPNGRSVAAGLVVNSAPGVTPADYPGTPAALGPAHALVRPEFAAAPPATRGDRVLVALGSANSLDRSALLEALLDATPLDVDWIGPPPPFGSPRVRAFSGLDGGTLAGLMKRSRVGLLSASSVCFEAACAGLPFVAVETATNQERLARGLAGLGVTVLPSAAPMAPALLRVALQGAAAGRLNVDGLGADRVAGRLLELTIETRALRLRRAVWNDAAALLAWANDTAARRGSFDEHEIRREEHEAWLAGKLVEPESRLFVAEDGPAAAGSARLERAGRVATVSLAVAPARRGRGIGGRILQALREWSRCAAFAERLEAFVREDNPVSLRLFERAGFARTSQLLVKNRPAFRFELSV